MVFFFGKSTVLIQYKEEEKKVYLIFLLVITINTKSLKRR